MINTVLNLNNIDEQHIEKREIDGRKVNIYFSSNANERIERYILENLLDAFDRRVQTVQAYVESN